MGFELAITSGIPIPQQRGHASKYPFRFMQVGDSFFISAKLRDIGDVQHRVSASALQFTKKNVGCESWKFCTRQTEHNGRPAVGVWRVA